MTGPILNPPRGYDTIKPLRSRTGEPLRGTLPIDDVACDSCGGSFCNIMVDGRPLCIICADQILSDLADLHWPPDERSSPHELGT